MIFLHFLKYHSATGLNMSCHDDNCDCTPSTAVQSLDEMDFERGIWYAAQYGDLKRVEKLLKGGCFVDKLDSAGYTALHYAARNGKLEVCRFLVEQGADVNAVTKGGVTGLCRAAFTGKNILDIF